MDADSINRRRRPLEVSVQSVENTVIDLGEGETMTVTMIDDLPTYPVHMIFTCKDLRTMSDGDDLNIYMTVDATMALIGALHSRIEQVMTAQGQGET